MIIGLTGGFGTGKSYVASIFEALGAKVLDADRIAHDLLNKGSSEYEKVVAEFGVGILAQDKTIDREKLGGIVFNDKDKLKALNAIVHPGVIDFIKSAIKDSSTKGVIVIDAPLLVEANLAGIVDRLIVVKASEEEQIRRCARKFGMKRKDCLKRIRSQIPLDKKIEMADFVIDNGGTRAETKIQVMEIWRRLWR